MSCYPKLSWPWCNPGAGVFECSDPTLKSGCCLSAQTTDKTKSNCPPGWESGSSDWCTDSFGVFSKSKYRHKCKRTSCPNSKLDPTTNCTTCVKTWLDPNNECKTCLSNSRLDPENGCKTCIISVLDPANGCKTCLTNPLLLDPKSNCETCLKEHRVFPDCTACEPSYTLCGDTCMNLDIDSNNCGSCGKSCPPGASCENGRCQCPRGSMMCVDDETEQRVCKNVSSDNMNCGSCRNQCKGNETCMNGKCMCNKQDVENCGSCGNACAYGEPCCEGQCTRTKNTDIYSSSVIDYQDVYTRSETNAKNNCGGCGKKCEKDQICINGKCDCPCFDCDPNKLPCYTITKYQVYRNPANANHSELNIDLVNVEMVDSNGNKGNPADYFWYLEVDGYRYESGYMKSGANPYMTFKNVKASWKPHMWPADAWKGDVDVVISANYTGNDRVGKKAAVMVLTLKNFLNFNIKTLVYNSNILKVNGTYLIPDDTDISVDITPVNGQFQPTGNTISVTGQNVRKTDQGLDVNVNLRGGGYKVQVILTNPNITYHSDVKEVFFTPSGGPPDYRA